MFGRNCLCPRYTKRLKIRFGKKNVCLFLALGSNSKLFGQNGSNLPTLSTISVCFCSKSSKLQKALKWHHVCRPCVCSKRSKINFATSNVYSSLIEALYIHKSPCQLYICRLSSGIFSKGFERTANPSNISSPLFGASKYSKRLTLDRCAGSLLVSFLKSFKNTTDLSQISFSVFKASKYLKRGLARRHVCSLFGVFLKSFKITMDLSNISFYRFKASK